jgi:hypothetical protein
LALDFGNIDLAIFWCFDFGDIDLAIFGVFFHQVFQLLD